VSTNQQILTKPLTSTTREGVELRYVGRQEDERQDSQTLGSQELFLGACGKLRQATIKLLTSVFPPARMERLGSREKNFVKFYVAVFNKNCAENLNLYKTGQK
jgi:hypothetical protein